MAIAPDITRLTKIQEWVATTNLILAAIGNGGSLTPVAGKFPIAGPGGKIDSGWIDFDISVVDADTLQGAGRAHFENADNLLTGTVDPARLSGTYTIDVQGNVTGDVTGNLTGNVTGNADTATDADKLDGQHGSYYQNAGNLNAGIVPAARLSGTYTITVNGNASTATKWASPITLSLTGEISGSANVDGSGNVSISTTADSTFVRTSGVQSIAGNKTFTNDVIVSGNFTVNGTTTTVNTDNMAIEDNVIVLNANEIGTGVTLGYSGLEVERGTATNARLLFRESDDSWVIEDLAIPGTYFKIYHEGNSDTGTTVNASKLNGQTGSYYLDRANHTGTQLASTVSDFSEAVDDRVAALLVQGTGISLSYNDVANTLTINSTNTGTVTSLSVVSANGISGTVANATTTPAITLSLGAITPTSVNSVVISGSATPTLSVTGTSSISGSHTGTSSGTNTGDQTITLSGGDVQSTGPMTNGTYAVNLTNTGVSAGTYHQVTVDSKGRVTAGTNNTQKNTTLTAFTNTTAFTLTQVTLPSWTAGDIYRMRVGFSVATNANRKFSFSITLGGITLYASGTTANLNTAGVETGGEIEFYLMADTGGIPRIHGRIEIDTPSVPATGFGDINQGTVHTYAVIGNGTIVTTPANNILTITETPSGTQTTNRYNYVLEKL